MLDAGFREVTIQHVRKAAFPVTSIPKFWDEIVKGNALIPMLKKWLGRAAWQQKEVLAFITSKKTCRRYLPHSPPTRGWA